MASLDSSSRGDGKQAGDGRYSDGNLAKGCGDSKKGNKGPAKILSQESREGAERDRVSKRGGGGSKWWEVNKHGERARGLAGWLMEGPCRLGGNTSTSQSDRDLLALTTLHRRYIHAWPPNLDLPSANTRHSSKVGSMLDQRRRRWAGIEPTLDECLVPVPFPHHTRPTLDRCWASVVDGVPILIRYYVYVLSSLNTKNTPSCSTDHADRHFFTVFILHVITSRVFVCIMLQREMLQGNGLMFDCEADNYK